MFAKKIFWLDLSSLEYLWVNKNMIQSKETKPLQKFQRKFVLDYYYVSQIIKPSATHGHKCSGEVQILL